MTRPAVCTIESNLVIFLIAASKLISTPASIKEVLIQSTCSPFFKAFNNSSKTSFLCSGHWSPVKRNNRVSWAKTPLVFSIFWVATSSLFFFKYWNKSFAVFILFTTTKRLFTSVFFSHIKGVAFSIVYGFMAQQFFISTLFNCVKFPSTACISSPFTFSRLISLEILLKSGCVAVHKIVEVFPTRFKKLIAPLNKSIHLTGTVWISSNIITAFNRWCILRISLVPFP